jgi:hypothetical protein
MSFIVYTGANETIITSPEHEEAMLEEYFAAPNFRDTEEYDREEIQDTAISFVSGLRRD